MIYQKQIRENKYLAQTEFKVIKSSIVRKHKQHKEIKTKRTELDYYGFETRDRPHIERFMEE